MQKTYWFIELSYLEAKDVNGKGEEEMAKRKLNSIVISLSVVMVLCAEMIPSVNHHALAEEPGAPVAEGGTAPCPQLDWSTIRSLPNTGNADDPARPDFQLSAQEEKNLVQSRARIDQWWAQHSSERTVDEKIKSDITDSVTPYQYSIAMPARKQETGYYCGVASTQMVSDYEWGFIGSQSRFLQHDIGIEEHVTTQGVSSKAITDFLNNHPAPNKTWTWNREQLPYASGETTAATQLFNWMDPDIQLGHGTVMSLITDVGGTDVWGEPYGLIGWNSASDHFVAGDGVVLRSDNCHRIMYIDPYETKWDGPASLGQHTIDAANMAHLMALNTGYLVH